ncbi:hypothetical protein LL965_15360 [Xanthomonas cassavae CFBP 4642]|uniref:Uncharacterized protein n=1 Tax=Xanthomonas cassavae CFBP 4642 TaxID=1219375 RepID=A0ABS8HGT0_9XANT|nr:hypothetical protein [Xanthomonas cassavae]MCC4621394.1 hypothetical protein [Xanthomonas cassavae CFBP 4642]
MTTVQYGIGVSVRISGGVQLPRPVVSAVGDGNHAAAAAALGLSQQSGLDPWTGQFSLSRKRPDDHDGNN